MTRVGDIVSRPDQLVPEIMNFGTVIALGNADWADPVKAEWSDGRQEWESICTLSTNDETPPPSVS